MSIELDHAIVSVPDKSATAGLLAYLLDVPWEDTGPGGFTPVYINDGLTLEFNQADNVLPVQHFCFRVSETEFGEILDRIQQKNIDYRSSPHGPVDMKINRRNGGLNIYWEEPKGVVWEILTASYARKP